MQVGYTASAPGGDDTRSRIVACARAEASAPRPAVLWRTRPSRDLPTPPPSPGGCASRDLHKGWSTPHARTPGTPDGTQIHGTAPFRPAEAPSGALIGSRPPTDTRRRVFLSTGGRGVSTGTGSAPRPSREDRALLAARPASRNAGLPNTHTAPCLAACRSLMRCLPSIPRPSSASPPRAPIASAQRAFRSPSRQSHRPSRQPPRKREKRRRPEAAPVKSMRERATRNEKRARCALE